MPLFKEEEVVSENAHKQLDIKEMETGESLGFFFTSQRGATSEEFGDFIICQGLEVNLGAEDVDTLITTAKAASFIPNTLLVNKIKEGSLLEGELYRIEKAWAKGQKFKDGKKAKGWGYKLFSLSLEPAVKKQLLDAYKVAINPVKSKETDSDGSSEPAKKPAV